MYRYCMQKVISRVTIGDQYKNYNLLFVAFIQLALASPKLRHGLDSNLIYFAVNKQHRFIKLICLCRVTNRTKTEN